jgi:hypothetical protein
VQAHGQGLGQKQQHTGAKSFGLTAMNDQRGNINVSVRGWWDYSLPCKAVMTKYNLRSINQNISHTILIGQPKNQTVDNIPMRQCIISNHECSKPKC